MVYIPYLKMYIPYLKINTPFLTDYILYSILDIKIFSFLFKYIFYTLYILGHFLFLEVASS